MDREQDERARSEKDSGPEKQGVDAAVPIPEPRYSVEIKKTRREAVDEVEKAQAFPFELEGYPVTSQEVSPIQLLAGFRDSWTVHPLSFDEVQEGFGGAESPSDLILPRLKIWESARLSPTIPHQQPLQNLEISLPPRQLLSVEPLEDDSQVDVVKQEAENDTDHASESKTPAKPSDDIVAQENAAEEVDPEDQLTEGPPPLYEFLFETGDGSLASREPICIVAAKRDDDGYQQTLETLCREQFRQYVGGKPLADLLAPNEADSVEETRIQNRIVAHDDSESDFFEFKTTLDQEITRELMENAGEGDLAKLHSRIDEFFTSNLGYLLLFVDDQYAEVIYEHLLSAEDIRDSNEIIHLRLRQLPDDVKRELVRLAWGNIPIETDRRNLDSLFHSAEDRFGEELEPRGAIEEITRHDQGESVLHYWVKCFVVEYLSSREGLTPLSEYNRPELKERIQTEESPWDDSELRPDIYVNRTQEVFEVETLYGTDHKKLNRTIDKYEGWPVKQINVILPNLACLRNLDAVRRKTQEEPGEMFKNDVTFWTLDLDKDELISVEDLTRKLHELYNRSEHVM